MVRRYRDGKLMPTPATTHRSMVWAVASLVVLGVSIYAVAMLIIVHFVTKYW